MLISYVIITLSLPYYYHLNESYKFLFPIIPKTLPIFYRKCPCLSSIQLPKSSYLSTILYCYVHMYRTLTYPKLFRSLSYCCIFFDYVMSYVYCSFLNVSFHRMFLNIVCTFYAGDALRYDYNSMLSIL